MESEKVEKEDNLPEQAPIKTGASGDALQDRLGEMTTVSESDLAEILAGNWQKIAGALLLSVLAVWLYNGVTSANIARKSQAAERFAAVQAAYGKLTPPSEAGAEGEGDVAEKAEASAKLLADNVSVLLSSDSGTVYADFANIYRLAAAIKKGDSGAIKEARAQLPQLAAVASESELEQAGLAAELATLLDVRSQLKLEEDVATVRETLRAGVRSAKVVPLELLLVFARLADSPELRKETLSLATELRARKPELSDSIEQELNGLGFSFTDS